MNDIYKVYVGDNIPVVFQVVDKIGYYVNLKFLDSGRLELILIEKFEHDVSCGFITKLTPLEKELWT